MEIKYVPRHPPRATHVIQTSGFHPRRHHIGARRWGKSAIFSVVSGVLLQPRPSPEPDQLVMIWEQNLKRNRDRNDHYVEW